MSNKSNAELLLDNPLLPILKEEVRSFYLGRILAADVNDVETIMVNKQSIHILDDVFAALERFASNYSIEK